MKNHTSRAWNVLAALVFIALILSLLTTFIPPEIAASSGATALLKIFPSLSESGAGGYLSLNSRLTYAGQWTLVPIYALTFIVAMLRSRKPTTSTVLTIKEKASVVLLQIIALLWVSGSLGLIEFPTCINGELLFSPSASLLGRSMPVDVFPGVALIAWASAICEAVMLAFSVSIPMIMAIHRIERTMAQPSTPADDPAAASRRQGRG